MKKYSKYLTSLLDDRAYLFLAEKLLLLKKFKSSKPQVFILGLPRSGTTLIYQYIVHRLKVAYFTNGVGRYYYSPCIITFLQHQLYGEYQSDFESNYGKVVGSVAPREAGSFWGRFFGVEKYIDYDNLYFNDIATLRNTIQCVQKIFGDVPFVNKNVKHLLRIDPLHQIFPNSYFVIVKRNIKDVALSILRGRYKNLGDPEKWWSIKPINYKKIKDLTIAEQIAYQLVSLEEKMEYDLLKVSKDKIIKVSYEEFCQCPEMIVSLFKGILGEIDTKNFKKSSFLQSINKAQTTEEKHLINLIQQAKKIN